MGVGNVIQLYKPLTALTPFCNKHLFGKHATYHIITFIVTVKAGILSKKAVQESVF